MATHLPRLAAALAVVLSLAAHACGGSSGSPAAPGPPAVPPPAPLPTGGVNGIAIDAVSELPLAGATVRVDGLGQTITAANGAFHFDAQEPQQIRAISVSSSAIVERATRLKVPGPDATLTLMPTTLDLTAFNEMFRPGGELRRWITPPGIVVQDRVLQFTSTTDQEFTALAGVMTSSEVTALIADLAWVLPQLTGNTFTAFADQQRETAAEGARVRVSRPGLIVIARYEGLTAATGFWGYTRWSWNAAGEMQTAYVMLDRGFEMSGTPFLRSLRAHEFGHALGYNHVTVRESVMNSSARIEPTRFDRDGAKVAFLRPPLNRSPDIDPEPFTGNLRALRARLFWHGDG